MTIAFVDASLISVSDSNFKQPHAILPVICGAGAPSSPLRRLPFNEGARNAGCTTHPQPRAQNEFLAHERSHHGCAGDIRRSARNGFNGLLRTAPGGRPFVTRRYRGLTARRIPKNGFACRSLTRGQRARTADLGRPREVRRQHGRMKKAPRSCERCASIKARASNTARGHRIPPRAS